MGKVGKILHKGKNIILVDLANTQPPDTLGLLPEAEKVISASPAKSALVLTDVTNAQYNKEVADAIKHFAQTNTPYVKASAVVGADGVRYVLLNTVIFISRREIKTFNDRASALDWLANH